MNVLRNVEYRRNIDIDWDQNGNPYFPAFCFCKCTVQGAAETDVRKVSVVLYSCPHSKSRCQNSEQNRTWECAALFPNKLVFILIFYLVSYITLAF